MKNSSISSAVVLDIGFAGYGIIRSLFRYNIPIIGFKSKMFYAEAGTRLCRKIYVFQDLHHLYELLINYAKTQPQKPVLYLTTDLYVNFILKNITEISQYYQIDFPDENTISILMNKLNFSDFAEKNNIQIPKTISLHNIAEIDTIKENLNFPVILKPWMRTEKWSNRFKEKAFLSQSFKELEIVYNKIKVIENNILVQEYIPGFDDHVYYCLTYFDEGNNCLAAFTGQKIRQWPVRTGSTSTTVPCDNDTIKNETLRIFKLLNYKGFGSIEYKKHAVTGEYYITEPTVGRLNQQEYVATLNGINIPLIAYNSLTGAGLEPILPRVKPIIYIDEKNELQSVVKLYKEGSLTFKDWLKSIKGDRAYRFFNLSDPVVGFRMILLIFLKIIKKYKN